MAALYHWLEPRSIGIAQFNHPSGKGALQWDNLAFVPSIAASVATIEIYGDQDSSDKNLTHSDAGWYWLALVRGWTVGPVMNWDTHHWRKILRQSDPGTRCGDIPNTLPCQRTLVLADAATPDAIMRALHARRTTATESPGLWATLRGPGGAWQGSTVKDVIGGFTIALTVEAGSSQRALTRVDIVSDNGIDPHPYYDGDNVTCLSGADAPCPRDARDADDDGPLTASFIEQHRRFIASGGYAVRKAQIDGPPANATIASVPLAGHYSLTTIRVAVPSVKSLRPDRKHFFYAIVYAGLARAWTSPIFTDDSATYADAAHPASPK
jgi:hypothetical protein